MIEVLRYGEHPRQELRLLRPDESPRGVVLFWHGGGWIEGSPADGLPLLAACRAAGFLAASAGYRLAPEQPYPAAVDDAVVATARVLGLPSAAGRPWYLLGYSAGAQLAGLLACDRGRLAAVGVEAADCAGFVGISGVYDLARAARVKWMRDRWIRPTYGDDPATHAAGSPLSYAGPRAPRTLLVNAELDWGLHRQAAALASRLRSAGVRVDVERVPGRNHVSILAEAGPADEPLTRRLLEFLAG